MAPPRTSAEDTVHHIKLCYLQRKRAPVTSPWSKSTSLPKKLVAWATASRVRGRTQHWFQHTICVAFNQTNIRMWYSQYWESAATTENHQRPVMTERGDEGGGVTPAPVKCFRSWLGFAKRCYWNGSAGTSVISVELRGAEAAKASRTRRGSSATKCENSISSVRDANVSTIRASGACSRTSISSTPRCRRSRNYHWWSVNSPLPVASTTRHQTPVILAVVTKLLPVPVPPPGDSRNDSACESLQLSDPLRWRASHLVAWKAAESKKEYKLKVVLNKKG
jgi:hypothetical protein